MYDDLILLTLDSSEKNWFDLHCDMSPSEHAVAFYREMWRFDHCSFMTCLPCKYYDGLLKTIQKYFDRNAELSDEDTARIEELKDGPTL
jgi:hypothetical protein